MIIRDAIHKDIKLSKFEEKIVRTKQMQRLHWIRQLGSTYQVYPCALHTRFDHSLGVFQMSKHIIKAIEEKGNFSINREVKALIPVMALVHDIAHLPFGHTFESELQIISNHDTGERLGMFLQDGQLGNVLGEAGKQITEILSADPMKIDMPYQLEIVKDTISADLLDYIKRDVYFSGIQRTYDPRIISYFNIASFNEKMHLVIDVSEGGAVCQDVLVEMEHLLRVRFTLGERIYNYHTKIAADAMIGKAVHEASIKEEFLLDKGDECLLKYLENGDHGSEIAHKIGEALLERRLLTRCYMLDLDSLGGRNFDFVTKYYRPGEVRSLCKPDEEELIKRCNASGIILDESELIIFCHEPEMNLKAANVLVREENKEPQRLAQFYPNIEDIQNSHRKLWRFYVFTRKDLVKKVAQVCQEFYDYPNKLQLQVLLN